MPVTAPIPGGPPQGPHRPLEEKTEPTPTTPESVSKVAKAAGREGTAASKMQTVPREKLSTGSSWLSRFTNWVNGLFQSIFGSKPKEEIKETAKPASLPQAGDIRARFQALPADQQRKCLEKMLDFFKNNAELGKKGLFREEGDATKREALKEAVLTQLEQTPGGEVSIETEDIDVLAAAFKTFLGAYLNHALTNKGYEALKSGGSQEAILEGLSAEDRVFMDNFFDFYRNFASRQIENGAMDQRGVAVVFAPSFVKDSDNPFAVVTVGQALKNLLPQG